LFGDGPLARYDGEILSADQTIGRILHSIFEGRSGMEDTAVVVTSDHGEEFRDHGGYAHRDRLFEELIRVPLIVSLPGVPPRRTQSAVGLLDVAPTVLDLFELPAPGRGRSILADVIGLRESPRRPIFASLAFFPDDPSQSRAVVRGDFKLIFDPMSGRGQTYDLRADPEERQDLASLQPGRTRDLMQLLVPFIERTSAP
jgi:arylsulfatase A-like enzyme